MRELAVMKVHRAEKVRRVVDFAISLTAVQPETRIGGGRLHTRSTPARLPWYSPLVLRYRLVIYRGAVPPAQIERWHREYAQAAKR